MVVFVIAVALLVEVISRLVEVFKGSRSDDATVDFGTKRTYDSLKF
jgi:hypothetical protein